jgi:hypothetical protein
MAWIGNSERFAMALHRQIYSLVTLSDRRQRWMLNMYVVLHTKFGPRHHDEWETNHRLNGWFVSR